MATAIPVAGAPTVNVTQYWEFVILSSYSSGIKFFCLEGLRTPRSSNVSAWALKKARYFDCCRLQGKPKDSIFYDIALSLSI
ncbi:hypothetical protein CEXT_168711 [Caerostris extrusa]|uniref:Uncharacterized protein n=1 Tax=Caerostris extrusa TaxID=172846 RepID=A0AAV4NLM7_CAEEX|nr:hypothetical protein CEXT_168711 [Caerostris extrusa]